MERGGETEREREGWSEKFSLAVRNFSVVPLSSSWELGLSPKYVFLGCTIPVAQLLKQPPPVTKCLTVKVDY